MKGKIVFQFSLGAGQLNKQKLRKVYKGQGRYLPWTNLSETDPATVWEFYLQLVEIEEGFKNIKGDLSIRPISGTVNPNLAGAIACALRRPKVLKSCSRFILR